MDSLKYSAKKEYHVFIDKQPPIKQKTFFGVEYDTLTLIAGFTIPIISFLLGFLFSILRDKFRERSEIKLASDSLISWIGRVEKSSKALLNELEKSKKENQILDNFQISKPDLINLHLNRLNPSDQNMLYKAFVRFKKGNTKENFDDYSKLFVDIDFLKDFQEMLLQNMRYAVEDFQNLFNQWNDSIKGLHKAKHILVGRRANVADEKIKEINNAFNKWFKVEEPGLSKTYTFLDNLEPILQNFYNQDPTDDELAQLLSLSQHIKVLYNQFIFERNRLCDLLSNFHSQLNKTINEMVSITKKIDKKPNKRFYL